MAQFNATPFTEEQRKKLDSLSHHYDLTQTAAEIKRVLATVWPDVKFSVTSERYSGGRAIRASWVDGPTDREVRGVMDVFQDTHFDGSDDSTHHSGPVEWNGHRFHFQSGYCSQSRDNSEAFLRACAERFAKETGLDAPVVETDTTHPWVRREGGPCGFSLHTHDREHHEGVLCSDSNANFCPGDLVNQIAHVTSACTPAFPVETADRYYASEANHEQAKETVCQIVLGELKGTLITPQLGTASGATMTDNEVKNGVEIRFPAKPEQAVIANLKAHGWRWSKFGKCWYAKRSEKTLAFARGLTE